MTEKQGRSQLAQPQGSTLASLSRGSYVGKFSSLPRLIDTKVPDIYPTTKSSHMQKTFNVKERQKNGEELQSNHRKELTSRENSGILDESIPSRLFAEGEATTSSELCDEEAKLNNKDEKIKKKLSNTSSGAFKNVIELSSQLQTRTAGYGVDMAQAIRTFAPTKLPQSSTTARWPLHDEKSSMQIEPNFSGMKINQHSFVCYAKDEIPIDLSLKISARFTSIKAFNWCQKSRTKMQCLALRQFTEFGTDFGTVDKSPTSDLSEAMFWQSLHTWMHPQSPLPPFILSALLSQETVFLAQRRRTWEDAFCSLYHMFRNSLCNLFYLCAQSFVVLFIGGGICGKSSGTFRAYMTRSTRGFRRLLQEQDVRFSMPLCKSEPEIETFEELQELTDFERSNPGQTRLVDSMITIDKSPKSLLAFLDNQNVHRLFNFLLNNRLMLNFTSADLPTLLAPVPFLHASLTVPEVKCKQILLPNATMLPGLQPGNESAMQTAHSLEIKDALLAPWVISKICTVLQKSHSANFEASLVTDTFTEELNIAQHQLEVSTHVPSTDVTNSNGEVDDENAVRSMHQNTVINHIEVIYNS